VRAAEMVVAMAAGEVAERVAVELAVGSARGRAAGETAGETALAMVAVETVGGVMGVALVGETVAVVGALPGTEVAGEMGLAKRAPAKELLGVGGERVTAEVAETAGPAAAV